MKATYINSAVCISAQDTLEPDFFEKLEAIAPASVTHAKQPSYKEYIAPALIRRMSKVVKMGSVAAQKALQQASVAMPEAIIVGTGLGCTEDSEKFLRNLIQNHEEFLTPTHFIQSTHNTVAGQIALSLGCHAYNFTYVNAASSLEFSMLDAKLQIEMDGKKNILVGSADETAERTAELYQLAHIIKNPKDIPFDILNSESKGVAWGEGASFFVLSGEKNAESYAELKDIFLQNRIEKSEIQDKVKSFLFKNNLSTNDIDAVMLGFGGDAESDLYYKELQQLFPETQQLYFKHLSGDFNTASGFAFFIAAHILKKQELPEVMKINVIKTEKIGNILIYNNFLGNDHCFTLLKKV